jgi:diguanylate cyclase (GGDEF)-like protein
MGIDFSSLDIKTLMTIVGISRVLEMSMMVFLYVLVKQYRGIKSFTVGRIISTIAYALVFSEIARTSPIIGIGSCLLVVGNSICCLGMSRFTGQNIKLKYLVIYNSIFIAIQTFLILYNDNFIYKSVFTTIFQGILTFGQFYFLFRNQISGFAESSRFAMTVYFGMTCILIARMVGLIRNPSPNFFSPSEVNALSLILVHVYTSLVTLSFSMMVFQRLYYDLRLTAETDELTGLLNRRAMMRLLKQEMSHYVQDRRTFGLLLIDIDHFKGINDCYGHDGGDTVLVHLAQILRTKARANDFASRWGGEEFLILLPNITIDEAFNVAERLRSYVEHNPTASGIKITISSGVAITSHEDDSVESLITAADHALYAAKRSGRNQVQMSQSAIHQ